MDRAEAIKVLMSHLRQCAMLMPHDWIDKNGSGELMDAFELAFDALREQEGKDTNVLTKWISVKDRLPKEETRVLVWLKYGSSTYTQMDTDRVYRGRWVRWNGNVTNWMPLPEPPDGGTARE